MKPLRIKLLSIICVMLTSCNTISNPYGGMENTIQKHFPNYSTKYDQIVIIPGAGCSTCISSAEEYFKKNIVSENRTLLILTQFTNKKLLKINFTNTVIESRNVYLDEDNIFNSEDFQSMYPQFIYLKRGSLDTIEYTSPESPKTLNNYIARIH